MMCVKMTAVPALQMMARSSTNHATSLLVGRQMGSIIMTNVMNTIMHQVGCDLDLQNKVMLFLMHLPQTKRD